MAAVVYLSLSLAGIRYGLPDSGHFFSYNCDELNYIEVLSQLNPREGKLNPHPFYTHPTCYLFMNATALLIAQKIGWIPSGDKEFFRKNPHLFARFYLVGRGLQILCGLAILVACGFFLKKIFNSHVASITVFFLSVCPAFIAASHFSQASIPVALFATISILSLLMALQEEFSNRWLFVGSFFAGVAIGTKYSALALFAPVLYGALCAPKKAKSSLLSLFLLVFGFVLTNPFFVLANKSFVEGASFNMRSNQMPIPKFWEGLIFPFKVAFAQGLGWPLLLLCSAGLLFLIFKSRNNQKIILILVWVLGFYVATVRVGYIATSARVFIVIPMIILMAGLFLNDLGKIHPKGKWIGFAFFCFTFIFTARYSLALVNLRLTYPTQKQVSDWVVAHVPRDKTIGIPGVIYWWTPDIVYQSAHHPERMHKPYKVQGFNFSLEKLQSEKPDYAINTEWERSNCSHLIPAETCNAYFDYFEESGDYEVAKRFPRKVGFGNWVWDRPEIFLHFDDDLWMTAMTVYKKKSSK
ncbi:MAG: hypothetical protein KCHDKBKB_01382 [Elusimicrobia bacterium]|nr:hypothetical protein [Elusimicrobiota bacterium]